MSLRRTLAYILGGAAAGGAAYLGISKLRESKQEQTSSGRGGAKRPEEMLVRVTENGRKYHRDTCQLLHGETRVITVGEALANYEPCKACHPPGSLDMLDEGFRVVGTVGSDGASTDGASADGAADNATDDERPVAEDTATSVA
jgi:hypothetical protein